VAKAEQQWLLELPARRAKAALRLKLAREARRGLRRSVSQARCLATA
jgi:hypothetical protein